jgi:hypothetical protein
MINPKVREAALDFIKSQVRPSNTNWYEKHFKGMTKSELADYSGFVQWLDNSEMWKSDLTVDGLWDVFKSLEYDLLMECYEDDLDF